MAIVTSPITRDDINLFSNNENTELLSLKGVNYSGREWVEFVNVNYDVQHNPWRVKGQDSANIAELAISFQRGIDTRYDLPILYRLPSPQPDEDGNVRIFGVVGGNHRISILKALGYTGYFFDIIEVGANGVGSLAAMTKAAMSSNVQAPRADATNLDIATAVQRVVEAKEIPNTEEDIRAFVKECCPTWSNARIGGITALVCNVTMPASSFVNWGAKTKEDLHQTMKKKFKKASHGDFDFKTGKYGFTMLDKGYFVKGFYTALKKFYDTGKESYIIGHVKSPDSNGNLAKKRLSILEAEEFYKDMIIQSAKFIEKTGRMPYKVVGFLPQDAMNEIDSINAGEVLTFTKQELEAIVKLEDAKAVAAKLSPLLNVSDEIDDEDEENDCDAAA